MATKPSKKDTKKKKYSYVIVHSHSLDDDLNQIIKAMELLGSTTAEWKTSEAAKMLRTIVSAPHFPKPFTVFLEVGYVDRLYRDTYYHHYASNHFDQSRNCLRLFFFDGCYSTFQSDAKDHFIGVSVIQPNGIIGRSYWHPRYFLDKGYYIRTADFTVTLLGENLCVPAFPYTMQDQEATTCAEVTILNLVEYYSHRYFEYPSIVLSDIEKVESKHSAQRIFPSQGLNYTDVSRNLAQVGLSPRIYATRAPGMNQELMQHYLYYYVESGIPFGLAVESSEPGVLHSVVCVGHGPQEPGWPQNSATNYVSKEYGKANKVTFRSCWIANSADAYHTFVVMDDGAPPYQIVQLEFPTKEWRPPQDPREGEGGGRRLTVEELCVPLYKRVFLEVDGAAEMFTTILTSQMGYSAVMKRYNIDCWRDVGDTPENPLIIRMFLTSSRNFLRHRMQMLDQMDTSKMDEKFGEVYQNLFCPRFVWVCELYESQTFQSENPCPIGEVVVDATAYHTSDLTGMNTVVLIHYPHYITFRTPDTNVGHLETNQQKLDTWSPFGQFRGNLKDLNE